MQPSNELWDVVSLNHTVDLTADGIQAERESAGPGLRTEIFFWGCSKECPGCINKWTETQPQHTSQVKDVLASIIALKNLNISFSGGEPLEQREALTSLLIWTKSLQAIWRYGNTLVYTGHDWEEIANDRIRWLAEFWVTGPFVQELAYEKVEKSFVGSSNQRVLYTVSATEVVELKVNQYGYLEEEQPYACNHS
jgi:anaerobic ribonucleoside-triphosphate reductase activating protein